MNTLQGNSAVPQDTASVANAKAQHQLLYDQITQDHARIGAEQQAERALFESTSEADVQAGDVPADYYQSQYHNQQ